MTGHRFSPPAWGPDHLSLDAIVAYVDDELTTGAHGRAQAHLTGCPDCRAEVVAQRQARAALRAADAPRLPSSLLHSLRSIPVEAELPPPPPGLGVTADGQFVLLRDVPPDVPPDVPRPPAAAQAPAPEARRRLSLRARVGAVSGLALGALAVGALAAPAPGPPPAAPGVFGGAAVLNVPVQARLNPVPTQAPATPTGARPSAAPDAAPVLDPRLRARLDDAPIGFHYDR